MNFAQLLTTLMEFLSSNLVNPIQGFISDSGSDITNLADLPLNLGFGQVTWLSINALDLLLIVIGFMVSITALVLTWKFFKFLSGLLKGLFTGIKK